MMFQVTLHPQSLACYLIFKKKSQVYVNWYLSIKIIFRVFIGHLSENLKIKVYFSEFISWNPESYELFLDKEFPCMHVFQKFRIIPLGSTIAH